MDINHNKDVTNVLLLILEKLSNTNINWMLTGSTNLFIQGLNVNAMDIDIVSTKDEIFRIEEIFKMYVKSSITYNESEKYRSWFGRLIIDNIQVDLMADLEYKPSNENWIKSDSLQNKIIIDFNNYKLFVNPIYLELEFYRNMKRKKDQMKIKLIVEYLKSAKKS